MTNRQRQAAETKNRIRDTALNLMKQFDYEEVTIQQICTAAEVSVGNFYHYFDSKEAVLIAGYPDFDEYITTVFIHKEHPTCLEAIRDLIYQQTAGVNRAGPKIFAQILRIQLISNGKYVVEESRPFNACLKSLVEKAMRDGEIDASHKAGEITGMILRQSRGVLFDWALRGGPYPAEEKALHDLNILLNSLRREP